MDTNETNPETLAKEIADARLPSRDLFSPFDGDDGYFILCVKDGLVVAEIAEDDDDYTEYHLEHLIDDVWRLERSDAAELCEFVYQGRIPDRAFFLALMKNQEGTLPESWENRNSGGTGHAGA